MPMVGNKKYSYTKEGMEKAKKDAMKSGKKMTMAKPKAKKK